METVLLLDILHLVIHWLKQISALKYLDMYHTLAVGMLLVCTVYEGFSELVDMSSREKLNPADPHMQK